MQFRCLAIGNSWRNSTCSRNLAVCLGVITLVCDNRPRFDVGAYVKQGFEMTAVTGFATCQIEGERETIQVRLDMYLGGEASA